MPVSAPDLVLAIAVTFFAAGVQATTGIGFAIISVPILSLLDPTLAPVPQILVVLPMVIYMAWRERHAIDFSGLGWILSGRVLGAGLGVWLIKFASAQTLEILIGVAVLAGAIILGLGVHVRRTPATQLAAGTAASVSSLVASMGGPPLALLYYRADGETLRSSLAAVFIFGVSLTVLLRAVTGEISETDVEVAAWLVLPMVAGLFLGERFAGRMEGRPIQLTILAVCSAAAIGVVLRALL